MQPLGLPSVTEVMVCGTAVAELQAGVAGCGAAVTGFWPVVSWSWISLIGPKSEMAGPGALVARLQAGMTGQGAAAGSGLWAVRAWHKPVVARL